MATEQATEVPLFFDGVELSAGDARVDLTALLAPHGVDNAMKGRAGVRSSDTTALLVSASTGMDVTVAAGQCAVQGTEYNAQGAYLVTLTSTATLTITTADATYGRYDTIAVVIDDNGDDSSTSLVKIVTGTPTAAPTPPTLPDNSIGLANVYVGAGVTSINAGNITDTRSFTVALGGILPVSSQSALATPPVQGLFAYDYTNHHVLVSNSTQYNHLKGSVTCTSVSRPSNVVAGTIIHETDTRNTYIHNGTNYAPLKGTTICTYATRPSFPDQGATIYETDTETAWMYSDGQWRPLGRAHQCTSVTRPANPLPGTHIFETDTVQQYLSDGTEWLHMPGQDVSINQYTGGTIMNQPCATEFTAAYINYTGNFVAGNTYDLHGTFVVSTGSSDFYGRLRLDTPGTGTLIGEYYVQINSGSYDKLTFNVPYHCTSTGSHTIYHSFIRSSGSSSLSILSTAAGHTVAFNGARCTGTQSINSVSV